MNATLRTKLHEEVVIDRRKPFPDAPRPVFIVDVDGTLADATHREHFVRTEGATPDWRGFFAAAKHDSPIASVIVTVQVLKAAGAEIWLWSGRSDEVLDDTKEWLYGHRVPYHQLKMRPNGDHTPDDKLKASWYGALIPEDRQRVVAVLEDRKRVVDMWRRLGVACFQVAPGEF